jgi:hypothetical protein
MATERPARLLPTFWTLPHRQQILQRQEASKGSSESSGMYCRVLYWMSTDVSEVRATSIIRSSSQKILSFILAAVRTWNLTKLQNVHGFHTRVSVMLTCAQKLVTQLSANTSSNGRLTFSTKHVILDKAPANDCTSECLYLAQRQVKNKPYLEVSSFLRYISKTF